ncbi:MAG: mechanosensitive ion channel domain-containing protein [Pirellulaceae bacterium]
MATSRSHLVINRERTSWFLKPSVACQLLALLVIFVVPASHCDAQNFVAPQSMPVQSYPHTTYPSTFPPSSYPVNSHSTSSQPTSLQQTAQPSFADQRKYSPTSPRLIAPPLPGTSSFTMTTTTSDHLRTHTRPQPVTLSAPYTTRTFDGTRSNSLTSSSDAATIPFSTTRLASSRNGISSRERLTYNRDLKSQTSTHESISPYRPESIRSARYTADQYQNQSDSSSEVIANALRENASLAIRWSDLAEKHVGLSQRVMDLRIDFDATKSDYDDVDAKLNHYGLTSTVGQLLQSKKQQLGEWHILDSQTLSVAEELAQSRQDQLDLEMNRTEGTNIKAEAARLLANAGVDGSKFINNATANRLSELLIERERWVADLRRGFQDYQTKLGELDSVTTELAVLTKDYRKLIDRHITWIRSGDPVSLSDMRDLKGGTAALFDMRRSADFGPTLERKLRSDPIGAIGLLATLLTVLVIRWRAKSWLLGIGSRHRMRESTTGSRKAAASILTVLVALAFPTMLYAVSRWLGAGIVSVSTLNASSAFAAAALVMLLVEICRQLLREHGFIDKHVDVELPGNQKASNCLTIIGFGLAVAAYTVTLMSAVDHGIWRGSVARFGFMFAMLFTAWLAHLALRPSRGFCEPLIEKFGGSVIHRMRWVIYMAAVAFPVGMMGLAALGYGFTANELSKRAIITLSTLLIGVTLWSGLKILCANAWHVLTSSGQTDRESDEYGPIESPGGMVTGTLAEHSLELKHHLAFLCQCALVLGAIVCFGWLWIDVFPSVRMGNPIVWTVQDTVSQASVDASGQTFIDNVSVQTPITALHLLLAAVTLWIAFQLAKLLPALFDALVLQRVSFDEGMEHFTLVLGRGLLFGAGCIVACKLLGVRWEVIQWLAVGLTIGVGFGMQDMVRNLLGGLIVLFEKPARLGDLITVGKVTGRVAAQRLRTTVVSDDEGREVIIPNKNFVSEDVVNWMAAGRLQAVMLEVAVTRDERPADLCRHLQELALEQPNVLLSPAPQATLVCVGQRSQRIEMRVWIEEDQDAERFQAKLLNLTSNFLRERGWWINNQPAQPSVTHGHDKLLGSRSNERQRRKRSA